MAPKDVTDKVLNSSRVAELLATKKKSQSLEIFLSSEKFQSAHRERKRWAASGDVYELKKLTMRVEVAGEARARGRKYEPAATRPLVYEARGRRHGEHMGLTLPITSV